MIGLFEISHATREEFIRTGILVGDRPAGIKESGSRELVVGYLKR